MRSRDSLFETACPWNGALERPLAQTLTRDRVPPKRRWSLSPLGTDPEDFDVPLPPHPLPSPSSKAPAKKKKKNARSSKDAASLMQSLLKVLQQQQQQSSSSESSEEELVDEVFGEAPLRPLPELSPLKDDLALSSSDEEGAPPIPAVSPLPAEPSFPDLLDQPLPPVEEVASMPTLDTLATAPSSAPAPTLPSPAESSEDPPIPALDNVTTQSVLFRPLGSQALIFKLEEGGEISGSFIMEGEHFGVVRFLNNRMCSFRIPSEPLIRYMAHVLHKCSFAPFSSESEDLTPF